MIKKNSVFEFSKYDYLIFDCDGVILDSNRFKIQAYSDALPDERPKHIEIFLRYHKQHGGVSRYEKFRYYYNEIRRTLSPEREINIAIDRFAAIVRKGMLECDYVLGVLQFIKHAKTNSVPLFVVSGSDENELREVFSIRGIDYHFNHIYGSPANKVKNTGKVVKLMGEEKKGLFFGDSKTDFDAANKFGLDFVFISGFSEWDVGNNISTKTITNFLDLQNND